MKNNVVVAISLILLLCFLSCDKSSITPTEEDIPITDDNLCQTWVLIKKEINNTIELLPVNDKYPVTLTFYPTNGFCGRHDANSYEGKYEINQDTISFSNIFVTDVCDIDWYLNYLSELGKTNKVLISSQCENTNNMQLQLSNNDNSIILYFINKKWFEETYSEFEEWYNCVLYNY